VNELPDVDILSDVDKVILLAREGRSIIGNEKTTGSTERVMPRSPPEVAGQHAVPLYSRHMGLPN
jgi:hypothetical protein